MSRWNSLPGHVRLIVSFISFPRIFLLFTCSYPPAAAATSPGSSSSFGFWCKKSSTAASPKTSGAQIKNRAR
ncbi:hypothetical protein GGI42DRAFT_76249 [Trichoderma sp. SZMC 28013]